MNTRELKAFELRQAIRSNDLRLATARIELKHVDCKGGMQEWIERLEAKAEVLQSELDAIMAR